MVGAGRFSRAPHWKGPPQIFCTEPPKPKATTGHWVRYLLDTRFWILDHSQTLCQNNWLTLTKDYVASMKWKLNLFCRRLYHIWFLRFFQFDNVLLLANETAISNLEFIYFRLLPHPFKHPSCYTLCRVQWVSNIVLASKI